MNLTARNSHPSAQLLSVGLVVVTSLIAPAASACGGFFCSAASPVDQSAERIIFAQDESGNVTQIVEVLYEGPADKFSWVLPVPGTPKPGVSSKQVFDRLQNATNPQYRFDYQEYCQSDDGEYSVDADFGSGMGGASAGGPPTVTVLDAGNVGPFDYETISVNAADQDPADVAVEWLEDNGYDVGPTGPDVLRPYLANGLNLIAFRLEKGANAGSIRPISLEYESKFMSIPIRPTAVAAQDDMPVLVWTLGSHRAVPTNYRGLEINELLIDWFNYRRSYDKVITEAANEAGGQGFVTELAQPASRFATILRPTQDDLDRALGEDFADLQSVLGMITRQLANYDGFLDVASEHLSLRAGVSIQDFVMCSDCYFEGGISQADPIHSTDLTEFRAALMEEVMQPFIDVADLMEAHDYLTRLYTTMSAEEMTMDPTFEFNSGLDDVSNIHTAKFWPDCDGTGWKAELGNGTIVYGTENTWPYALDSSELPLNARVVQYSSSGAPEVITDNLATIRTIHDASWPATMPPGASFPKNGSDDDDSGDTKKSSAPGCTYNGGQRPSPWALLALSALGLLALRRRSTQ